jgi:hypothetical protein
MSVIRSGGIQEQPPGQLLPISSVIRRQQIARKLKTDGTLL